MTIGKYSFGMGDRFGHQGKAQLAVLQKAKEAGVTISPVWNKSYREHQIIYTTQDSVRQEADEAIQVLGWKDAYFVDADHVGLKNVDGFIQASDFFTLDVADFIGEKAVAAAIQSFVDSQKGLIGSLKIAGLDDPIDVTEELIKSAAEKYLFAVQKAGETYRYISGKKGNSDFVPEVSMDETDAPQTPVEMLFILAMIAMEKIPAQTIAPKFTGRFNKGVDYVGDVDQFAKEFEEDLAVIQFAVKQFGLPSNLKLSVHSGSDKFAIYNSIQKALKKYDAGVHVKTAGTTWLEELIGLAESGGDGLKIAKEVYASAFGRFDELCGPYATVIDIDLARLPDPAEVDCWDGPTYASTLRHDQSNANYNPHFRQLLHVGYKVASEMGERFLQALKDNEAVIAKHVTENLWERHIKRLFL
ncbi:hypothetical protein HQ585_15500 [candidate division KSB1 bacterium]|nr:hypothetical protein [candidate division KSB1 bacterium]